MRAAIVRLAHLTLIDINVFDLIEVATAAGFDPKYPRVIAILMTTEVYFDAIVSSHYQYTSNHHSDPEKHIQGCQKYSRDYEDGRCQSPGQWEVRKCFEVYYVGDWLIDGFHVSLVQGSD